MRLSLAEEDKLVILSVGDKIKGITNTNYVDEVKQLFNRVSVTWKHIKRRWWYIV
jgi:hypothetical protein